MSNLKVFNDKFNLDIEDLLLEIGTDISGKTLLPKNPSELIKIADIWYKKTTTKIAPIVCNNERIKKIQDTKSDTNQNVLLAAAIADLITGVITGVSPITVAVLVIKKGLNSICKEL